MPAARLGAKMDPLRPCFRPSPGRRKQRLTQLAMHQQEALASTLKSHRSGTGGRYRASKKTRTTTCMVIRRELLSAGALSSLASLGLVLASDLHDVPAGESIAAPLEREHSERVAPSFGKLPPYFIENRGQVDSRVAYYLQGRDSAVYFTAGGLTFALARRSVNPAHRSDTPGPPSSSSSEPRLFRPWTVKLDFIGSRSDVRPQGRNRTPVDLSYFKGPLKHHKTGVPAYSSVVYEELWPGIDLVFTVTSEHLKYEYLVRPGADPGRIRLAYRGADVAIMEGGELEVSTPRGSFQDKKPYVYQEWEGRRETVDAAYQLLEESEDSIVWSFKLGAYDPARPLIVDPAVWIYAGYIGGAGFDEVKGVALDSDGYVYITGRTNSTEATFPVRTGPELIYNPSLTDAFVAKLSPDGKELIWAGYIGGASTDCGQDIAIDGAGNVYVTGETFSTKNPGVPGLRGFPSTVGPDLTFNGGDADAFVAKVKADGTALVYAGFIGGIAADQGLGIAVDPLGNAYVTGSTESFAASFPVTAGPDLTFNGADFSVDAFVAKISSDGASLLYAGYIGGSEFDTGHDVAVDDEGHAYVVGTTSSSEATFPVTIGPDLTWNGSLDAFVAKVQPDGAALIYAGYLGGSSIESGEAIAIDGAGAAYLAGQTLSTEATFPVNVGPDLTYNGSDSRTVGDAFVAKVNARGSGLEYAGYIGGSGEDRASGIAAGKAGNAYVAGVTNSNEETFAAANGPDNTFNGGLSDGFVATVKASGEGLIQLGYLGGSGNEEAFAIAADGAGNAYVGGTTSSTQASFLVAAGPDLTYNGGESDGFIAKLQAIDLPEISSGGIVNSAGYGLAGLLAPESWAAVFGERLASATAVADSLPLPTSLGGTSVIVTGSDGAEHAAPLQFVSFGQINFLVPAGVAAGDATVLIVREAGGASSAAVRIENAVPGLFAMNAAGSGVAAGFALRVRPNGSQVTELLFRFDEDSGRFEAAPTAFGPEDESLFLVLFGTGFRAHSGLSNVELALNGQTVPLLFAGPQPEFAGLDQADAGPLPRSLAGAGLVQVRLSVEGKVSNTVTFEIR